MKRIIISLTILSLLTGCQYTNRRAYNQGWSEGYQQADRWHHPATPK